MEKRGKTETKGNIKGMDILIYLQTKIEVLFNMENYQFFILKVSLGSYKDDLIYNISKQK